MIPLHVIIDLVSLGDPELPAQGGQADLQLRHGQEESPGPGSSPWQGQGAMNQNI